MSDSSEPTPPKKKIIWVPPDDEVIRKFANDVCERLGPDYNTFEIKSGFADFLRVVCRIKVKQLNKESGVDGLDLLK